MESAAPIADEAPLARALSRAVTPTQIVPLSRLETLYARQVLACCSGHKTNAARALGVSRRTLGRMIAGVAG
jgi:ActR/RegA family two-component response regulator